MAVSGNEAPHQTNQQPQMEETRDFSSAEESAAICGTDDFSPVSELPAKPGEARRE
jgi:uncharacterized protein YacL (UPF0231 family)